LNFEIRKNVLKFDQVLNQQRDVIYRWRRQLLRSENIEDLILEWRDDVIEDVQNSIENYKTQYESLDEFSNYVDDELSLLLSDNIKKQLLKDLELNDNLDIRLSLKNLYSKNLESDNENFMNLARMGSLSFIDQSWKNHLSEMDYLRSGIGLRAMGQRDPLVEYQKEGYDLFEELIDNVKLSVVRLLLNFEKVSQDNIKVEKKESTKVNFDGKSKIGRNDPCHCGSGLKYKKCGMVDKCSKSSQTN
ncbi:MAG: SEC-C metal-binding domain-containing protein, partial [Candidatus Actinomarina sp.]